VTTNPRWADGSAGDTDYARIGGTYTGYRQPDPRIAERIERALGDSRTVLNIGAGAGSYEPTDRHVTPVEPSASMRVARPPTLAQAIDAVAEDLPFADQSFDAAMTTFSVHQWADLALGLSEMRRVTKGPIVILTCDPGLLDSFWLNLYAPEVIAAEASRYPMMDVLRGQLGPDTAVEIVPIPLDCKDGFNEAYYGRPEALLNPAARLACSAWSHVPEAVHERFTRELDADLHAGVWDDRYGTLRSQPHYEGSLVLITSTAA
jgi:SAM-dependent methyltransferase